MDACFGRAGPGLHLTLEGGLANHLRFDKGEQGSMAVKVRLARAGAKKRPVYRVVVADVRKSRDGRFIEAIGQYDPRADPAVFSVDDARLKYWLGHGAKPTETVKRLILKQASAASA